MALSKKNLPLPYRILNATGQAGLRLGLPLFPLKESSLQKAAIKDTGGLTDFGDSHYEEGLDQLLKSIHDEVPCSFLGRLGLHANIMRCLSNRLLLVDYLKKRPEINKTHLVPPFLITGLPRTGTTFLQRMLAVDSKNYGIPFWEINRPIPHPGERRRAEGWRKKEAIQEVNIRARLTPELDAAHYIREQTPEEDMWLMGASFKSWEFWVSAPVHSYFRWLLSCQRPNAYREWKQILQVIQTEHPGQRLILKAPAHLGALEEVHTNLPQTMIIQTHRDPGEAITSIASLLYTVHRVSLKHVDIQNLRETLHFMFERSIELSNAFRQKHPNRIYDIQYKELVSQPIKTVKRVYEDFGLDWSLDFEQKLRYYIRNNPKDEYGRHRYQSLTSAGKKVFSTASFKPTGNNLDTFDTL